MQPQLIPYYADKPRASVLVLHGYAEHQGRYSALINHLTDNGFDVYTYDQYGHGTAPGPRARVDVGGLIIDHLRARREVEHIKRAEPLMLFGHSMGGTITAASAIIDPHGVDAVALSGPAFATPASPVPPKAVKYLLPVARIMPGLPLTKLSSEAVSQLPDVVADYESDPLNYRGSVPLLTAATMMMQGRRTLDNAERWKLPLIVFHGDQDELASIDASWQFVLTAVAHGAEAQMVEVPGAYHEVFNEPQAPLLRETLTEWYCRHCN